MKEWQDILTTLGITSIWIVIILIILGFVGKLIISKFLELKIENAKQALEKSLSEFNFKLEQIKYENQTRFSRLHEERALVLKELYKRLRYYIISTYALLHILESNRDADRDEQRRICWEKFNDFVTCFEENRIVFSEDTCLIVDEFVSEKAQTDNFIDTHLDNDEDINKSQSDDNYKKEYLQKIEQTKSKINASIIPIQKKLEKEFRTILGVNM